MTEPVQIPTRAAPEGFVERWETDSLRSIAASFGMSRETAKAIARALDLPPKNPRPRRQRTCRKTPIKPRGARHGRGADKAFGGGPVTIARDISDAGRAADYLRRYGPVIRCDATGSYSPRGTHWRRGSTILTAAEIIARAERNGWVA